MRSSLQFRPVRSLLAAFLVLPILAAVGSAQTVQLPSGLQYTDVEPAWGSGGTVYVDLGLAVDGLWSDPSTGTGVYDAEKWVVVFKFPSITIGPNTTVKFLNHPSNAPVMWLVEGDVTIGAGAIVDLSGERSGAETDEAGVLVPLFLGQCLKPGPGGSRGAPFSTSGDRVGFGIDANWWDCNPGPIVSGWGGGQSSQDPSALKLMGGRGALAQPGRAGASGGGALCLACQGTLNLEGEISAKGGPPHGGVSNHQYVCANPWGLHAGGGGMIRIAASNLMGAGSLITANSDPDVVPGIIRVETFNYAGSLGILPRVSIQTPVSPLPLFPSAGAPTIEIEEINSSLVPIDPLAQFDFPDLIINGGTSLTIRLKTENFPSSGTPQIKITVKGDTCVIVEDATLDPGQVASSSTLYWTAIADLANCTLPSASPLMTIQAIAKQP